jgi:hypothetical protein
MPPAFFGFCYFSVRVLLFSLASLDCNPPTYTSSVIGTKDMHHDTCLVCWGGVVLTFCWGWLWTVVLPVSTPWAAGITGVCYHSQLHKVYINKDSNGYRSYKSYCRKNINGKASGMNWLCLIIQ